MKLGNCWIKHHQSGCTVCSLDRFLNNLKNGAFLDSVIDRRDLETGINISKWIEIVGQFLFSTMKNVSIWKICVILLRSQIILRSNDRVKYEVFPTNIMIPVDRSEDYRIKGNQKVRQNKDNNSIIYNNTIQLRQTQETMLILILTLLASGSVGSSQNFNFTRWLNPDVGSSPHFVH